MAMPLTHHRFTVDEFLRMAETGILAEDDRVELLDGQIVEMSPIGPRHAGCVKSLIRLFSPAADRAVVSAQDPVVLGPHAAPQPDLAILRPRADGYRRSHPGPHDTLLVIEVADTSVAPDREGKLPLYAAAGIPDAWLVNLPDDVIEVHRDPRNGVYTVRRIARRGDALSPLRLPDLSLPADDILG